MTLFVENVISSPGTNNPTLMFSRWLDPRSQLAIMCLITAFVYWNNDLLFLTFSVMAFCTRVGDSTA